MKIFLDTSALFKLYHVENGSEDVEKILHQNSKTIVFLSELTQIEFISAVWKRFRKQDIDELQAMELIKSFEFDFKSNFKIFDFSNCIVYYFFNFPCNNDNY